MADMELYKADAARKTWQLRFTDHQGYPRQLSTRTRDRSAALSIAHRIETLMDALIRMQPVASDVEKWVQAGCHPLIKAKLIAWKLVTPQTLHAGRLLSVHVEEWKQSLSDRERKEEYIGMSARRVLRLLEKAGIEIAADITAERVHAALVELRRGGMSAQTCNHYLDKMKQFIVWMVGPGRRLGVNPLIGMKGYDEKVLNVDKKRKRRALSAEEQRYLLAHIEGVKLGMTAEDRVFLYRFVLSTGLRANEAASLTPRSFDLDGSPATCVVLASDSKAKREDVLVLRIDTAVKVRDFISHLHPDARLWPHPHPDNYCKMLQEDLEEARAKWMGEPLQMSQDLRSKQRSVFLLYKDHAGRFADFHALRHTFISDVARVTPNPKTTMTLARHRDIKTTMKYYTHVLQEEQTAALARLQSLEAPMLNSGNAVG